jgi:GTP-binding protein
LHIELRLIADIGFAGLPNAGKSSLLDALTNAHPEIAGYPFTTKVPNLGVVNYHYRNIVLADIPGIIEGASRGAGLGDKFLRHIARTAGIAVLIDLSAEDFAATYATVIRELEAYAPALAEKPRVVVGTKMDLPDTEGRLRELQETLPGERVYGISSFLRQGLDELVADFHRMVVAREEREGTAETAAGEEA